MKTKFLLLGAFVSLLFFSCTTTDETVTDTTPVSKDDATLTAKIDATVEDVTAIAEDQFSEQKSNTAKSSIARISILPECATITTIVANNTWTRTIDFGTAGCTLRNGNVVKGKIIISGSTDFAVSAYTIYYSFEGFYHNGNLVEGDKFVTLSFKSTVLQSEVHPVLDHNIDLTVTFPDGRKYDVDGTRTTEMTEGYDTLDDLNDNVFLVTGNATVTRRNGAVVTHTIIDPLRFEMGCDYAFPVSGKTTITKNNTTATIDFGDGTCDKKVTVTIGNLIIDVTIN